ncbi:MAG TPA: hypothetical protein VGO04_06525 [Ensifer sp.]|jgi:site-specific recombinase XerD|uniref:hypothetical protein n=1 Tax=Ensifer sp. TaxID=1872086 RepID=UPI002E100981|nr:hypothetical protein [Ensifer sp.]
MSCSRPTCSTSCPKGGGWGWLFPGQQPGQPITTRQLKWACHAAAVAAKRDKRVSMHTLRYSFAPHLLVLR